MFLVKVLYSEQIVALCIVYKSEGCQMISAINSLVLAKLHLGSERADLGSERAEIREVINKEKQSFQFWKAHHSNFPTLSGLVPPQPRQPQSRDYSALLKVFHPQ